MDAIIEQLILQMPTVGALIYLVWRLQELNTRMTERLLALLEREEKN